MVKLKGLGIEILKPEYTELQINGIYIYTINGEEKNGNNQDKWNNNSRK